MVINGYLVNELITFYSTFWNLLQQLSLCAEREMRQISKYSYLTYIFLSSLSLKNCKSPKQAAYCSLDSAFCQYMPNLQKFYA